MFPFCIIFISRSSFSYRSLKILENLTIPQAICFQSSPRPAIIQLGPALRPSDHHVKALLVVGDKASCSWARSKGSSSLYMCQWFFLIQNLWLRAQSFESHYISGKKRKVIPNIITIGTVCCIVHNEKKDKRGVKNGFEPQRVTGTNIKSSMSRTIK